MSTLIWHLLVAVPLNIVLSTICYCVYVLIFADDPDTRTELKSLTGLYSGGWESDVLFFQVTACFFAIGGVLGAHWVGLTTDEIMVACLMGNLLPIGTALFAFFVQNNF